MWGRHLHGGDFVIRTTEDLSWWERDPCGEGEIFIMGATISRQNNVSPRRIFYGGDNSVTPAYLFDLSSIFKLHIYAPELLFVMTFMMT